MIHMDRRASEVLLKPVLTEKSLTEAKIGRYTFLVAKNADKKEIKDAIQKFFSVHVLRIRTNRVKGSRTKRTKAGIFKTPFVYKKARVVLEKGQTIELFAEKEKK